MVGGPGSFKAWDGMTENVVIVNGMTKFEIPLKGFGIVECGGLVLAIGILPKLLLLHSIDQGEQATSCHDVHAILWLLHAPNIIFGAITDARDCINTIRSHLPEILKDVLYGDKGWPIPTFFNQCGSKNTLLSQLHQHTQTQNPLSRTTYQPEWNTDLSIHNNKPHVFPPRLSYSAGLGCDG